MWSRFSPTVGSVESTKNCRHVCVRLPKINELLLQQSWPQQCPPQHCSPPQCSPRRAELTAAGSSCHIVRLSCSVATSSRLHDYAGVSRAASCGSTNHLARRCRATRTSASGVERPLSDPRLRPVCELG